MCECALESERIVEVLVQFYNITTKHNHCPKTWLKVADVMLKKSKRASVKKVKDIENDRR